MKKLLLLLILSSVGMQANAQFGVRAGANVSNINQFAFANRAGIHLGAYYAYEWKENIVLEAGAYYSQKGYNDQKSSGISENFNYLSVPVIARYKFLDQFNAFLGPQASILAGRKRTNPDGTISQTTAILRGYDLSALVGVGMDLPQGFNVQIAYDYGLISLNYFDFNVKNRTLQLSVGKSF
ncbi:porin family protein [Mongoliitalea daihaiensis]|uniref:porin family protein n=1 Tax=Mongoliitalea daihaiensis TaxID=2782006 RepID=UPI001F3A3F23|nr:porin family protein [Mongoliitalea daihaiensis]UJP65183.1 PorT family protein [Mongoliitalea daihaiensis]